MRLRWFVLVMGVVCLTAGCARTPDRSGPYPSGDIDLIVPAEAGDTTDTVARAVAPCLADRLGVDVVVRNLGETSLESAPVDSDAGILRGVVAGDFAAGLATLTPELLSSISAGEVRLLASGDHRQPKYLPEAPTIYEVVDRPAVSMPDLVIDTAFSAPDYIGDAKYTALSATLEQCLSTDNVQRDLGAEFVPADQIGGGEQRASYWDLERGVRLGLNLAEMEGR